MREPRLPLAFLLSVVAIAIPSAARADDDAPPVSQPQMKAAVHDYYAAETKTSFLFVGYGVVTSGAGGVALSESGDFAHGFGWSSLILGGVTALGGAGYGIAAKLRGDYYEGLAANDPVRFQREEADRIQGTNSRFWLYLGSEIAETLAGIGIASYGLATRNDLYKGIGAGAALQGIGLFVIDVPGARRASLYQDDVRRFRPGVAVDGHSVAATIGGAL